MTLDVIREADHGRALRFFLTRPLRKYSLYS